MTYEEKAIKILEGIDHYFQIDWNLQDYYTKAIVKSLKEIDAQEAKEKEQPH